MTHHLVLVDSSVWIQCLKEGNSLQREQLDRLLADDRVAICGPIKAEVLSGARSLDDFNKLSSWFEGLNNLSIDNDKIWNLIAEKRFKLARKGVQQKLIDLLIACVANEHQVSLWTLDEDFERMRDVVSFKIYRPDDK